MAKSKTSTDFAERFDAAVAAPAEIVEPMEFVEPAPAPLVPDKPIEYDLTDTAVLHELRKKGLLWRVKAECCPCFLCVCETADEARSAFLKVHPGATGKIKTERLAA